MFNMRFYKQGILITAALAFGLPTFAKDKKTATTVDEELRLTPGDEKGNEMKSLKAELIISKSEEKAMAQLQKLMRKYKGTALEPSLQFRLAELYMRKAKTANFFEIHRDSETVVRLAPTIVKHSTARSFVQKAVDTYEMIEKRFVHFRDMDLVLFNSGFALQSIGQDQKAMVKYNRVIEDFSESALVADAHLAIGEWHFGNKRFQASFDEFEKIRKFPEARVFPYGLYKGAWALYNLNRIPDGLKQLEEAVLDAHKPLEEGAAARLDVSREATDDMVVFFEDVRPASEAVSYFRKWAGDERVGELVTRLGKLYQRHGRYQNLEVVYTSLIRALPRVDVRPQLHVDLAESYEYLKRRDDVVGQLEALSDVCSEKKVWASDRSAEALKGCWQSLTDTTHKYASSWHKEFRKKQDSKTADLAIRAYGAKLKHLKFDDGEDKFRFAYAELLFERSRYRDASAQYFLTSNHTKDSKVRHDASYASIVSLEKEVGEKWSDTDEREFARLAKNYLALNPSGQYTTDVRFKKAFIAYEKGRFSDAAPELKGLAVQFGQTERGTKAAHLYLDVLNTQKKFETLRDESRLFVRNLKFSEKTRGEFKNIYEQAAFKVIQSFESEKKFKLALDGYIGFVNEDPRSSMADKALFNGVRCANLIQDWEQVANLSQRLIEKYPESGYKLEVAKALLSLYEAQANLIQAAQLLLKLSDWEPSTKWKSQLAAADYFALGNALSQALVIYRVVTERAPQAEANMAVERQLALAERTGGDSQVDRLRAFVIKREIQPQASVALAQQADKEFSSHKEEEAFRTSKKVMNMRKDKNASRWALAKARFIQARVLENEFDRASLKSKPERLSLVIGIKAEKLEATQRAYQEVIGFGDIKVSLEAMARLGGVYQRFSDGLSGIELPADMAVSDRKKLKTEFENMALPIGEKGADQLNAAIKAAKDAKLFDGSVAVLQAQLNKMARKASGQEPSGSLGAPIDVLPRVD